MYEETTIAAIATAPGEGGIGIIRLSGVSASEIADKIFHTGKIKTFKGFNFSRMKYFVCDLRCGNAAQADDADSPFTGRGSDGGNRCLFVHTLLLCKIKGFFPLYHTFPSASKTIDTE